MSPNEATFARVHVLAIAAMAAAAPAKINSAPRGLTPCELARLAGLDPKLLASLARLLSHLPCTPEAAAARFAARRVELAAKRVPATSRAPGPRRVPAVAVAHNYPMEALNNERVWETRKGVKTRVGE